jgi:hypothetical protein
MLNPVRGDPFVELAVNSVEPRMGDLFIEDPSNPLLSFNPVRGDLFIETTHPRFIVVFSGAAAFALRNTTSV